MTAKLSPPGELDWSGRGASHVDFDADDVVPLLQGRFLGHGMNGGVFETTACGQKVAWKRRYCRRQIASQELREMDILKKLDHQHVIKVVGTYTHGPFLGLLLWPVAVCDLGTFMDDADTLLYGEGTTDAERQAISRRLDSLGIGSAQSSAPMREAIVVRLKQSIGCISSAIAYLHSQSIRHKDIKPTNMLLSSTGIWVTDFGSSTDFSNISQSVTANGERGTPKYFAPEVAAFEANGRSADIFSLGCVFLEMLALCNGHSLEFMKRLRPDKDHSFHANLDRILCWLNFADADVNSFADEQLIALVERMMAPEPEKRPTATGITSMLQLIDVFREPSLPPPPWGNCCAPRRNAAAMIQGRQVTAVTVKIGNMHRLEVDRNIWRFGLRTPGFEDIVDYVHICLVSGLLLWLESRQNDVLLSLK
jgi:serine/threonine protein kinase